MNLNFDQTGVLGDLVTTVNVFEDSVITGGAQTLFGIEGPVTITNEVELPNFIGFYDIDFGDDSLSLTLVDNSGATDLVLPAERYDRHYIEFDGSTITSVSLDGSEELNEFASVEVLEPGYIFEPADLFGTGIQVPMEFEDGGLLLEFGEGTDLTNLGVQAKVNFTSVPVPEPPTGSVSGDSVTAVNTFEDAILTGGLQTIFGLDDSGVVTDAVEFPDFVGFYDIDISDDSLSLTLADRHWSEK